MIIYLSIVSIIRLRIDAVQSITSNVAQAEHARNPSGHLLRYMYIIDNGITIIPTSRSETARLTISTFGGVRNGFRLVTAAITRPFPTMQTRVNALLNIAEIILSGAYKSKI